MLRITTYDSFKQAVFISTCSLYQVLYIDAYKEDNRRLQLLEINSPELYHDWLERWKSER